MLSFAQIQQFYPPQLHSFGSFLLREYLQYKILALIFNSDFATKFAFLGGTCLRIVHQTNRFSEDLDFSANQSAITIDEVRNIFNSYDFLYIKKDYLK
jgi:predicted nucleotidyltransferase component of viral defense system